MLAKLEYKIQISEIFYSLQGEGLLTGTPFIFIRFFGCNLDCKFCDTAYSKQLSVATKKNRIPEFYEIRKIIHVVEALKLKRVCITGGEPFYQEKGLNFLLNELYLRDYFVQLETNSTSEISYEASHYPLIITHLTVSPKLGQNINLEFLKWADEVKCPVSSQAEINTYSILLDSYKYSGPRFLQPIDNDPEAVKICVNEIFEFNSKWRLSLQVHKLINIR